MSGSDLVKIHIQTIRMMQMPSSSTSSSQTLLIFCFFSLALLLHPTSSLTRTKPPQQELEDDSGGGDCALGSVMFVFGDSLSDAGNLILTGNSALQGPSDLPYGMTYFRTGAGRFSDGRLIVDCLRQTLGLPFLPPYLSLANANFSHGVNYAVASSTALNYSFHTQLGVRSYTDRDLDTQLLWHQRFLGYIQSQRMQKETTIHPNYYDMTNATYFLLSGGNDIGNFFLSGMSQLEVTNLLPLVVEKISNTIQLLYANGARTFIVSGITKMGCLPSMKYYLNDAEQDERGCVQSVNEVCYNYTRSLGNLSSDLRLILPDSNIIFIDLYSAFDEIMSQPAKFGLIDVVNTCCGPKNLPMSALVNNFNPLALCGHSSIVCNDPNSYLVWDGIHSTDNVHRQIVNMLAEGKFISPQNALAKCNPILLEKA